MTKRTCGFLFVYLLKGGPFDIIGQGDLFGMKTFGSDKKKDISFHSLDKKRE